MIQKVRTQLILSLLILICFMVMCVVFYPQKHPYHDKVAQMIMVGFDGFNLTKDNPIYKDVAKDHIGGVILFNTTHDKTRMRNIRDYAQVKKLISDLQDISSIPLFVAVDQEGGQVSRLPVEFGVSEYSAWQLGKINDPNFTAKEAQKTTQVLKDLGFNVNFAPVVDIVINPNSIIMKKERSFSADDPNLVVQHATEFIQAFQKAGILPVLKHFPGHGSATGDTHEGFVDITNEYQEMELIPYQILISQYDSLGVMVAHVYNSKVDSEFPLSLSYKNVSENLQQNLGFKGLIFSDDLQMGALLNKYSWKEIVIRAIQAGNNVLVIGNNLMYDPDIVPDTLAIILKAIDKGEIDTKKIDDSYNKIMSVKNTLLKR